MNFCINSVPVFLRRAVDMESCTDTFKRFDESIDKQLFAFMEKSYDDQPQILKDRVKIIRSLPRKLGGLGLMEHAHGVGEKNLWAARIAMRQFLSQHYPNMIPSHRGFHRLSLETFSNDEQNPDLKAALQRYYEAQENIVYEQLQSSTQHQWFSATFRSNHFRGNGKWLNLHPMNLKRYALENLSFACLMRTCLGIEPITKDMLGASSSHVTSLRSPISFQYCLCDNSGNTNTNRTNRNPLHCFDCDKSKGLVKARHDVIRDVIIHMVKKAHPRAVVRAEPTVEGQTQRPDILIHLPGSTKYLDVSFVNPASPTEITARHTDLETDAANKYREEKKGEKYQNWTQEVIPFVLETTGRLGPSAKKFFETITANCGRLRGMFMHEIQAVTAYYNGLIFTQMIYELKIANGNIQLTANRRNRN
jgi:hypothetical protein